VEDSLDLPFQSLLLHNFNSITRQVLFSSYREDSILKCEFFNMATLMSYGPPWDHYLGGYQDRILGGPLGLLDLRCTAPDGVKHKDYGGEVLG
jgi:hypothetical protein